MTVAETGTDPGGTEIPAVKIAFFHVLTYFENDTRVQLCVACPQGWLGEGGSFWNIPAASDGNFSPTGLDGKLASSNSKTAPTELYVLRSAGY